ncbi:cyclically-permuted mutarotase family protein [Gemella cuniculi]|uniref:cyclically-permuted mutarotase family protein n=1 Tax=Gemella cuniculi TaxID=150240 RepID=UPI003CCC32C6
MGTAGLLKGVISNNIIIGGGANFPDGLPVDGGIKVNHKDIFLYQEKEDSLVLIDQIQFNYPLAYGATAQADNKLYYITTKNENSSEILEITIPNNKLSISIVATLPFTVENIIAEISNNILYFGVGTINGNNTNELYSYNLNNKKFDVIGEFPGKLRSQALSHINNNSLIIYGGGAEVTYNDGYEFNLETESWKQLADAIIDQEELSLLGADWTTLNKDELLVVGGFNKDVWKEATFNLTALTGEEKEKYRDSYFRRSIDEFNWNKKELVYNLKENSWRTIGDINFDAACGHTLLSTNKYIYSVMGEIKPAVRSPFIHQRRK